MKELYLEVFCDISDDGICIVPLETAISLFLYSYCSYPPLLVTFVISSNSKNRGCVKIKISKLLFDIIYGNQLFQISELCKLPIIVTEERTTVIAGLCAVLRQVIKLVDQKHPLLGFKQSCLYACAESSLWTKFCEVDIVETVNNLLVKENWKYDQVQIPEDVVRFEVHMHQPVKIHNIQKQKRDMARLKGLERRSRLPDSRLDLLQELDHTYAEGPELTLADIMLYTCFYIIFENLGSVFLKQHLPLSFQWFDHMSNNRKVKESLKLFLPLKKNFEREIYVNYILPKVNNQSLYKGEVKKRQPKRHFYTRQEDIEDCFEMIEEMEASVILTSPTFGSEIDFDWTTVPTDFRLDDNQIPIKRLERKGQQLENMTKAVLKIAKRGDRIVDFCSGSGHLGLILAHALPQCQIILIENKEQSLNRAKERAAVLKLSNVVFCQSNVDYFQGRFDIGVSLHACGVATDLVIERCIQERASFVCCPCCYGSIQSNHMITYPRSKVFQNSRLTLKEYLILAHSSDQTHYEDNAKTSQGNRCMSIIDSDRCLRAKEAGYSVVLSKLFPPTCTPKNNLLVGIP